jgi:hypothetical protein
MLVDARRARGSRLAGGRVNGSILERASMRDALRIAGIAAPNSGGFTRCPFHDDGRPSLHLVGPRGRETGFRCFGCDAAGGILDFLVEARISPDHAHAAQLLEERMGESRSRPAVVAQFIYDDGDGNAIARVDRIEPGRDGRNKDFLPYLATENGFADRPGLNGSRLPLYYRGEVLKAAGEHGVVFLVEGEGKADALRDALRAGGSMAAVTTIASGANMPIRDDHVTDFAGAKMVVVLPDADAPGRAAAETRARTIAKAHTAVDIRIVDLYEGANDGRDVADWLAEGRNVTELRELTRAAPRVTGDRAPARPNSALSSLGIMSDDEFLARMVEEVDWMIEGLLREAGIMLLSAKPKVGKSELARNLVKAAATGGEFLGRRCVKSKVLWVGLDEAEGHLRERQEVHGLIGLGVSWVTERPVGDKAAWLREVVRALEPDLVIVDTIGRLFDVDDFNDYSKVTKATQVLLDLRSEYGTTFVMLHHNNNADGVLGSVQWQAMVDTIMVITRAPESAERFVRTTQRAGTDLEPSRLSYDPDTGSMTIAEPKFIADQRSAEQKILDYISRLGRPATRDELSGYSGRGRAVGRAAVDALASAGLLSLKIDGKKRLYAVQPRAQQDADELLEYAAERLGEQSDPELRAS